MTGHAHTHSSKKQGPRTKVKRERATTEPEITAQPKSLPEELDELERDDQVGLSIDPDDMGRQFLEDATEQGDETVLRMEDGANLSVTGAADSDQAFSGPTFEANQDVWENTVNIALQEGSDEAMGSLSPPAASVELELAKADDDDFSSEPADEVDLTQSVQREGSLFDREGAEPGEVESPRLETDDTHTHSRWQKSRRAPRSAR